MHLGNRPPTQLTIGLLNHLQACCSPDPDDPSHKPRIQCSIIGIVWLYATYLKMVCPPSPCYLSSHLALTILNEGRRHVESTEAASERPFRKLQRLSCHYLAWQHRRPPPGWMNICAPARGCRNDPTSSDPRYRPPKAHTTTDCRTSRVDISSSPGSQVLMEPHNVRSLCTN